jgi:hypothetical protein
VSDTANITLRNFPVALWRKVRIAALEAGKPLGPYVAEILEQTTSKQVSHVADVNKDARANTDSISDVQSQPAIRADARRKPLPASTVAALREQIPELKTGNELPRGRVCAHGTKQGYACWQCGGKAKIEQ